MQAKEDDTSIEMHFSKKEKSQLQIHFEPLDLFTSSRVILLNTNKKSHADKYNHFQLINRF